VSTSSIPEPRSDAGASSRCAERDAVSKIPALLQPNAELTVYRMRLIPIQCVACAQFALVGEIFVSQEGQSLCDCGGTARALPGGTYSPDDATLFDAIVASLQTAEITWMNAARLVIELEACRSPRPVIKLMRLRQLVPALSVIELIASSNPATARKAIGMFETLLEALSNGRSRSGILPSLADLSSGAVQKA
jgi:hypothetical protein